jgi:hypothetical protein
MGTHPHGAWVMLERVPSSASKQIAHLAIGGERILSQRKLIIFNIDYTRL